MKHIFVSYRSTDLEAARGLREILSDYLPRQCHFFVAPDSIECGEDYVATIKKKNLECTDALIVLCTPHSLQSTWVLIEIGAAWALDKPIQPIRLGPDLVALPEPIDRHQSYDAPALAGPYQPNERKVVEGFVKAVARRVLGLTESRLELRNRIDKTLDDVRHDFYLIRQGQPPERTTISNHETMELSRIYVDLNDENVKEVLGELRDPLWQKFELVRNMWDAANDWGQFQRRWDDLDRGLAQIACELRFHRRVDEQLQQAVPELTPFAGKRIELIVREDQAT